LIEDSEDPLEIIWTNEGAGEVLTDGNVAELTLLEAESIAG
jgi:hypothetical protein